MGFSRQEYWNGLPCPPPGDLPDPGIKPMSLMSPALVGRFFTTGATWDAPVLAVVEIWVGGTQWRVTVGEMKAGKWKGLDYFIITYGQMSTTFINICTTRLHLLEILRQIFKGKPVSQKKKTTFISRANGSNKSQLFVQHSLHITEHQSGIGHIDGHWIQRKIGSVPAPGGANRQEREMWTSKCKKVVGYLK